MLIAEALNTGIEKTVDLCTQEWHPLAKAAKDEDSVYRLYYDFREPLSRIAGHRVRAGTFPLDFFGRKAVVFRSQNAGSPRASGIFLKGGM